jgi:hypothetical protein
VKRPTPGSDRTSAYRSEHEDLAAMVVVFVVGRRAAAEPTDAPTIHLEPGSAERSWIGGTDCRPGP